MKKAPAIIVGLCLVAGILLFLNRPSTRPPEAPDESKPAESTPGIDFGGVRPGKPSTTARKGDASEALAVKQPILHVGVDFLSGELENLKLVDGQLQLGDDPKFVPRLMPYKHFGVHVSQEIHVDEPFESISPVLDLTTTPNSEVTFEIRTKTPSGVWSSWQEVPRDNTKPVRIEFAAISYQYRATLYANDLSQSPKLRSIRITTRENEISPDPAATFSASNRP